VILVAVAIVIAIAVAFWASGLVGIFTRFEKLEILSAYQHPTEHDNIVVKVKNTGTSPTSIIQVVINGVNVGAPEGQCMIDVGREVDIIIETSGLMAGVTYEVMLRTSGGKQYPTAVLAHSGVTPGIPDISSVNCPSA
jgi:hypothetical protein